MWENTLSISFIIIYLQRVIQNRVDRQHNKFDDLIIQGNKIYEEA